MACDRCIKLHPRLTSHSVLFVLHVPYSCRVTVSRQINLHAASLSFPLFPFSCLSAQQSSSSALSLFFGSPDQTWGPTFHPIPLFLSDHLSIHLSFISVSWRSLVGAERWQACVCLAPLSAFLMSLKHRGSAYYGDEEIQAGQRWQTSLIGGPLLSSTLPSLLSCPFLFSPLLTSVPPPASHLWV